MVMLANHWWKTTALATLASHAHTLEHKKMFGGRKLTVTRKQEQVGKGQNIED